MTDEEAPASQARDMMKRRTTGGGAAGKVQRNITMRTVERRSATNLPAPQNQTEKTPRLRTMIDAMRSAETEAHEMMQRTTGEADGRRKRRSGRGESKHMTAIQVIRRRNPCLANRATGSKLNRH